MDRSRRLLDAILPAGVSAVETRADIPNAPLLPAEQVAVGRAVESRRREFATARACARAALEPWGLSGREIPVGPSGDPQWPPGIVGSITHCSGYRGCAVARSEQVAAIGIDAEPNEPLPDGLLGDIAVRREREWVRDRSLQMPKVHWGRLLFSIKEAVFKAWFPLAGRPLEFEDAVASLQPAAHAFEARLGVPGPLIAGSRLAALSGSWVVADGMILTAVTLPRPTASSAAGAGR